MILVLFSLISYLASIAVAQLKVVREFQENCYSLKWLFFDRMVPMTIASGNATWTEHKLQQYVNIFTTELDNKANWKIMLSVFLFTLWQSVSVCQTSRWIQTQLKWVSWGGLYAVALQCVWTEQAKAILIHFIIYSSFWPNDADSSWASY